MRWGDGTGLIAIVNQVFYMKQCPFYISSMNYYLGTTDWRWYQYLSQLNPEDVNFWQPGGRSAFQALNPGGAFLFKLKSPHNAIGGVGFFTAHSHLPLSLAWDTFRNRNGFDTFEQFRAVIQQYRHTSEHNPVIGCIALTNPVFFKREDWIPTPEDWGKSIVQGKKYATSNNIGASLWQQVEATLLKYSTIIPDVENLFSVAEEMPHYENTVLHKVRIGQGAFRLSVIEAYNKRCSITGEKTLPVLEAAHIKPYAELGPNYTANGLLLRSDMHKLFDEGYITITPNLRIEVSKRIREEFHNGREYYQYHGKGLLVIPSLDQNKPSPVYLEYHNRTIFRP